METTVTHMVDYLLEELGKPTALIGTMYRKIGDDVFETKKYNARNLNRA